MSPCSMCRARRSLRRSSRRHSRRSTGGIACVQRGEPFPAPKVSLIDRFKTHPVNGIFYKFFVKSGPFTVSDACIGCGKCALSCPVNGIDIVERLPHWNGACTHCMACICRLPGQRHRVRTQESGQATLSVPAV